MSSIVISVVSILLFAYVSAVFREHAAKVFLAYIVVFVALSLLLPRARSKRMRQKIKGSVVLRVDKKEALKMMMSDSELSRELEPQLRLSMIMILVPFIIWIPASYLLHYITTTWHEDVNLLFLGYVAFYGMMAALSRGISSVLMPKRMIVPLNGFEIRSDGIVSDNVAIAFPLDASKYEISLNFKRGFIDIRERKGKFVYRLYVNDIYKVKNMLERYGKVRL